MLTRLCLSDVISSPLTLFHFNSFFLHTIVLFNPSVTFNHPSITPSASFNGPPIISPPSNILSTVPPSLPSVLPSIPRPFGHPSVMRGSFPCSLHPRIAWEPIGCSCMLVSRFPCMIVALGARHCPRGLVLHTGMVQCKTVRLDVFRAKEGLGLR